MKIRENKRIGKYLNIALSPPQKKQQTENKSINKLWDKRLKVIPIVFSALGTCSKGFEKRLGEMEIRERISAVQTTKLQTSVRIFRKVLETRGNVMAVRFQCKAISKCFCEKLARSEIIIIQRKIMLGQKGKTTQKITEEISLKVLAKEGRLKRYRERVKQYKTGHSKTTKGNSTDTLGEMTRKRTNNRVQEKPNNFGVKYGNQENITTTKKKPNRLATWQKN